jgi:uncharacterized protein
MQFSIFQKNKKSYFDYFEQHAQIIHSASELLIQLFKETDATKHIQIHNQIKNHEHEADQIIHQLITQMNTSGFILPLDREDILALAKKLDDVIDYIDDCAEAFAEIYQLQHSTHYAKEFSDLILKLSELLVHICKELRKPAHYSESILENCITVHRMENLGDTIKKDALHEIFAMLKSEQISLSDYLAWDVIYRTLELLTDKAEDCANIAEQIVIKYS